MIVLQIARVNIWSDQIFGRRSLLIRASPTVRKGSAVQFSSARGGAAMLRA